MKLVGNAPKWFPQLVAKVCHEASVPEPHLVNWYSRPYNLHSTGRHTVKGVVGRRSTILTVTAGSSKRDQLVVSLHELAHHIRAYKGPSDSDLMNLEHHSPEFWDQAFALYAQFNVFEYARVREAGYRKEASHAAARSQGKTGSHAKVSVLPKCQLCSNILGYHEAKYDFAVREHQGRWAYGCEEAFRTYGGSLGVGLGQILVVSQ